MTDVLDRALDELIPAFTDESLDWDDVLDRSQRGQVRRLSTVQRHPRRVVVLFAVVLGMVALLATPAFGVQGYLLHLLGRHNVSFANSKSAPNVIKKEFLDLPIGAPPGMSPRIQAAQTRAVARFSVSGRPRTLWVAPTTAGGYCFLFEGSFGGCRQTRSARAIGSKGQFSPSWLGGSPSRGVNASIVTHVGGDLTAPAAARITALYADGTSADVPFVWVSAPIAAGFYSYDVPTAHWNKAHRLVSLTLSATNGKQLGREVFPYMTRPRHPGASHPTIHIGTPRQRILPTAPPQPPSAPSQQGSADGFHVVVGHNGAVQFTQIGQTAILRELVGHSVGFDCSRITREFGILTERGLGQEGRLASKVGFDLFGVGTPVDFCEVQASIGRTWPDRLHNRAAVEIPLTATGRRYLADRQTARDLALFVRSRRMQQLRKEPAAQARRNILQTYSRDLAHSPIEVAVAGPTTLRFSEASPTGKTFTVTVRNGRIRRENLKPYAFVF